MKLITSFKEGDTVVKVDEMFNGVEWSSCARSIWDQLVNVKVGYAQFIFFNW